MCSAMVLPTLGRTLFRNSEATQLSNAVVTSSGTSADPLGKPEPHEFLDFCSMAASGFDVDSDVDMSSNIGQIITSLSSLHSLSSQLGRTEPARSLPAADGSLCVASPRQWQPHEKRTCDPLWGSELAPPADIAASDGSGHSPAHLSDASAEMFDTDGEAKTPPLRTTACEAISSSDDLLALQPLQPLHGGPGAGQGQGQAQTQELDIEKLMTDYLYDPEDLSLQTTRLDELEAALARVSGTSAPSPAAVPTPAAAPVPVASPVSPVPAADNRLPVTVTGQPPSPVRERPALRWGGADGSSSILEGVLRGTLAAGTRIMAPPKGSEAGFKSVHPCFPAGGFQAYASNADVRAPIAPAAPHFPCETPGVGSPGRMDCTPSPVGMTRDVFSSSGALASPPLKKDASRKRKYAKRSSTDGEAPPSRGRLLHFCPVCSKGFKDKYSVNVHVRTHTGEKPFQCELCNKCFRQKAHLAKHVHIHSSPRPPPTKR